MMPGRAAREIIHPNPVWREKSDFIIAAEIDQGGQVKTEELWARRKGDLTFEICCIPFFIYDLALGDVVETDDDYIVKRTVEKSGRFVFRVWFEQEFDGMNDLAKELSALGAAIEWSSRHLLGVDAADESQAQSVADYLAGQERKGHLTYETGST